MLVIDAIYLYYRFNGYISATGKIFLSLFDILTTTTLKLSLTHVPIWLPLVLSFAQTIILIIYFSLIMYPGNCVKCLIQFYFLKCPIRKCLANLSLGIGLSLSIVVRWRGATWKKPRARVTFNNESPRRGQQPIWDTTSFRTPFSRDCGDFMTTMTMMMEMAKYFQSGVNAIIWL